MTLILFILILSVLILIHELGHFFAAKLSGVRVEEFGLGLPPKIIGKKFGETTYSLNALPFGGFVKLTGEDISEGKSIELIKDKKSFAHKKPLQKAFILVAGVFMNLLLAVTLFYILLASNNFKTFQLPLFFDYDFKYGKVTKTHTVVVDVLEDSAADKYGIVPGNIILEINGVGVRNIEDLRAQLNGKIDTDIEVKYIDIRDFSDESERSVILRPESDESGNAILGVYLGDSAVIEYGSPIEKLLSGPMHAYNVLTYSGKALGSLISLSVTSKDISPVSSTIAGPVGIYNIVGGILDYGGSKMVLTFIDYMALMSLSLGIINIFPFPALDGGRLLFVMVEFIAGRKINPKIEASIHRVGMIIVLTLLVLVTIKDIFV